MSKVFVDMSMSLHGFIAGPNAAPQNPLGDGGHRLHQWMYDVESWRERQSLTGGHINQDDEIVKESFTRTGAYVMGSQMFGEGELVWPGVGVAGLTQRMLGVEVHAWFVAVGWLAFRHPLTAEERQGVG